MGATVTVLPNIGKWRVTCIDHPQLDRIVNSPEHAANIVALHDRLDHPEEAVQIQEFRISTAAGMLVTILDDPAITGPERVAATMIWKALTGLPETEAINAAYRYAMNNVTAYEPPF